MCVREIEVVEAGVPGSSTVVAPAFGVFCDGEVRGLQRNDRRIVGAGDGDGEWVLRATAFSVVDGDVVGEGDGFTNGEEVELEIAVEGPVARVVDVEEVESVPRDASSEER